MAATATKYRFRVLDIATIVAQLADIQIDVTPADLENPQPQTAHHLYACLVDIIMGVNGPERDAVRFAALEHMENPELHEESLPEARFNSNLRKVMHIAGVHDFQYSRDLYQPQKQRLKVHMSALINIVLYRNSKLAAFSEKAAEAERIMEERQKLEMDTQQAQAELRQLRQQREREEPELHRIAEDIAALEAGVKQHNSRQATLKEELQETKVLVQARADKIAQTKVSIGNSKQENVKLQSLILQSPEKVKKNIEDMEHSLEGIKTGISESAKRSDELKARHVHCCKIEKDIKKCLALLGELEQETNKYKKGTKQSKENKARKLELQKQLQELITQEQSVQRNINLHGDKATKAAQKDVARKETAEQTLRDIKEEKQKIEKDQKSDKSVLDQQAMEVLKIQQQMTVAQQEYEKTEREEVIQYRNLVSTVQKYHQNMYAQMQAAH